MSGKVDKILSKLEKLNRANEELVSCLIDDPTCLDAFQHQSVKKQVYKYAIAYFEAKYIETQSCRQKMPNNRISILLNIAIDKWRVAKGEEEYKAATNIARQVFDASIQELRIVPNAIRVTAFKIIREFLTEMSQ
ncbi:MAG: hypothetical protein IJE68_06430 [Clostridia bacterium]|nr:hypothetical protein [Clostridia bacterium]